MPSTPAHQDPDQETTWREEELGPDLRRRLLRDRQRPERADVPVPDERKERQRHDKPR